jgi:CheY-like chemotaxis protein
MIESIKESWLKIYRKKYGVILKKKSPNSPSDFVVNIGECKPQTVLLVDDEKTVVDPLGLILMNLGYRTLVAMSGEEAIEICENNKGKIDLIILDLIMPGMSGGEIFDKVKEIDANINVLLISGASINGEARDILARGCDGFLQKPFTVRQLSEKVMNILNERK